MHFFAKNPSSVARRIHISFVLAAALPLLILASASYFMVSGQLQERSLREVHALAKDTGMAVYDRLKFVGDELKIFRSHQAGMGSVLPDVSGLDLEERTHGLFRVEPRGEVLGDLFLGAVQREALLNQVVNADRAKPLLIMIGSSTARRLFMLVAESGTHDQKGWLGAELNTQYLWDTANISERPERVCILDPEKSPVFCNQAGSEAWLAKSATLLEERGRPRSLSIGSGEKMLTAAWSLFLKPHYQFERWTVLAGVPRSMALASIRAFDRIFAGVAVLALVLAFVLGSRMIKGNLRPLSELGAATRALADGRFEHRIQLDSGDEFQELGEAFNGMASQIGRQFDELDMLARLDRSLQRSLSISDAVKAGASALTALLGPGRCAILCHERWEAADSLWHTSFSNDGVSEVPGAPAFNLGAGGQSGPIAALLQDRAYLRYAGETQACIMQVMPIVNDRHVKAEIMLADPQPGDAETVNRVADVAATTVSKLVLEQRLLFQARHDWLTGLPNRLYMHDLFDQWAIDALRERSVIGMLVMNLDRFKQVNDAHGHAQGDELLCNVAERLSVILSADCVLSRFGGDEFVIMLRAADSTRLIQQMIALGGAVNAELDRPLSIAHRHVRLSASMGGAVFPRHGDCFEVMLQNTDAALRAAKTSRSGSLLIFTSGMRDALAGRMDLEQALKGAVSNREVVLHYQPVVDATNGRVVGAEALMRWQRPGVGLEMPGGFMDVAEDSGLIVEFGSWALAEACRQLVAWRRAGLLMPSVSVNVSAKELADSDFENRVMEVLRSSELDPQHLVLEVTETALIGRFEESAATLGRLRAAGIKVMVDDFGTGYASFKYLKMLPVDGVKIDRLFVKDLPESQRDRAIVTSVVSLARANGLKLVAEGIETEAQARFLRDVGVPNLQGFLFDRGLPSEEFELRLRGDQVEGAMSA